MEASLGNAPERDFQILAEAATHMGYSFDIQDDIVDTFASLEQYGRPPGGDIAYRKKPLHIIYTLKLADREGLSVLKNLASKEYIIQGEPFQKGEGTHRSNNSMQRNKDFFASLIDYIEKSVD